MEPKMAKISFGFSKVTNKKSLIIPKKTVDKDENKIELIKCLEGQSIKLLEEKQEQVALVIPLKESTKTSSALASLLKRRAVLNGETDEINDSNEVAKVIAELPAKDETIEQRAARELLAEIQGEESVENEQVNIVLPLKPEDLPLDGATESTIDDYENIPITQFGLAMLRGMGWKEEETAKKSLKDLEGPIQRPKGMGLGADKAIKQKPLLVKPEANETLEIRKNAFIRVLAGKYKDLYGQIEGLDDHAGRVIVKLALGGTREAFNEFLVQPISKNEYAKYGKVINSAKYDEYKKMQNEHGQIIRKIEENADGKGVLSTHHRVKNEYGADYKQKSSRTSRSRSRSPNGHELRSRSNTPNKKYSFRRSVSFESSTKDYGRHREQKRKVSKRRHSINNHTPENDSNSFDSEKHNHSKKKSKSKKSKKSRKNQQSSDDEDKRYKKKTKKSKKPKSRSQSRGRR